MSEIINQHGGITFSGGEAVSIYQAIVLKSAIGMYARTRMKVNRSYTPTNMLATAGRITGKTYKRGQFQEAIADLDQFIILQKEKVPVVNR